MHPHHAQPAILSRFENVKQTGDGQWSAKCPAHEDRDGKSLAISSMGADGRCLINCFAGCPPLAVLHKVNATFKDLYPDREPPISPRSSSKRSKHSSQKPTGKIVATYDYHDEQGNFLYQVCRLDPKDFRQRRRRPNGQWGWGIGENTRRVLYRLPAIASSKAILNSPLILIVEGEKSADRLTALGYAATNSPGGASQSTQRPKWVVSYSESLAGCRLVLIPDNDDPGRAHMLTAAQLSYGRAASIQILTLPRLADKADIYDWLEAGNSTELLDQLIATAPHFDPAKDLLPAHPPAHPQQPAPQAVTMNGQLATSPVAALIIEANDDPHLLARLFLAPTPYKFWREEWYRFNGHCYRNIPASEFSSSVNAFIKQKYDADFLDNPQFDSVLKVKRGQVSDVIEAMKSMAMVPAEVEIGSWLNDPATATQPNVGQPPHSHNYQRRRDWISMANGILCIDRLLNSPDNNDYLIPHSPQFWSTISLPYNFDIAAECPKWNEFLRHNLEGDLERISVLQEWAGYCLTPDSSRQKFLAIEGEGSNGKSVFIAALHALIGPSNVSSVPLASFSEPFDLANTLGKLLNVDPDCAEVDKVAEGKLKAFTSGDRMFFNRKGIRGIDAIPTARMMMAFNNRPHFTDRSGGLWRRMLIVPFRIQIQDSQKIFGMDTSEFWEASGELPGILNWAIAGLHRLKTKGWFTSSKIILSAIDDYQTESNPARKFLKYHYVIGDAELFRIPCDELYSKYQEWCKKSGHRPLSDGQFGKEVKRTFQEVERSRIGPRGDRRWMYCGIAEGYIEEDDDDPLPKSEKINF